jgi:hypothetical protein
MVTPTISHRTWVQVKVWTDLAVISDGRDMSADDFSFEEQLEMLMDLEPKEQKDDMDTEQYTYSHPEYPNGETRHYVILPGFEDYVHRPQVSDAVADQLEEWVDENILGPVSAYDFEERVQAFLEVLGKYEAVLDVRVEERDAVDFVDDLDEERKQEVLIKKRDGEEMTKEEEGIVSVLLAQNRK